MAREEWRLQLHQRANSICSYKKITLLICFLNIVVALYSLRSLYASLSIYSGSVARNSKFFVNLLRMLRRCVFLSVLSLFPFPLITQTKG